MNSEKIDAAIKKITKEANGKAGNRKYQIFSELLIDACTNDDVAEKLLNADKTIQKADALVSDAARKNDGFIENEEAHRILFEYFGIAVPVARDEIVDYSELLL